MYYKSKLTTFLIFSLLLGSIPFDSAGAVIRKKNKQSKHRYNHSNPWSFQFAFDGRSDVPGEDEFSGVRLSLAYEIDRQSSVRLSIGGFEKGHGFDNGEWIHTDNFKFIPFNQRTFDVEGGYISLQYLLYPARSRKFDFFVGLGPRLSAEEGNAGTLLIRDNFGPFQTFDAIDTDQAFLIGAGVETTAGLEWFVGHNLSLIGEYGFVLQNQWYVVDVDYIDDFGNTWTESESFSDGLHLERGHIKLGIALHF